MDRLAEIAEYNSAFRNALTDEDFLADIRLPEWAEDKARGIAREKGRDYYAMRSDWLAFAKSEAVKGNPPKNPGAAFVAWAGKQQQLR